jgi:signal peptidase II
VAAPPTAPGDRVLVTRPLPRGRPADWRPSPVHWASLAAVATAAVAADQVTKSAISRGLALGETVDLAPPLTLWHVQNRGIAFGAFTNRLPVVAALTAAAVVWMLVFFARSGGRHALIPVALGLLLGGSLSNLFDRVWNGYVTDFIYLHWWPTFNFADSFIVCGVALLLVALFRGDGDDASRPV